MLGLWCVACTPLDQRPQLLDHPAPRRDLGAGNARATLREALCAHRSRKLIMAGSTTRVQ
jgi:hypothetical protein